MGVPRRCGGWTGRLWRVHHASLLRGPLPPSRRVVTGLLGPGVSTRSPGRSHRRRPPLRRERGQCGAAARSRFARRLRRLGRGGAPDHGPSRHVRRGLRAPEDRPGGIAHVSRRSPRRRRLTRVPSRGTLACAAAVIIAGVALALAYPRFDIASLAWVALVPVLVIA